ncbi:hypothetical protein HMPREF1985_01489 [Mitsuokella sp. oral taxon 131 str. W9106]|nr:hypothetical protein HMPREF1985_01489 [Mitsuokella sp. oral taxon 131 str. W9106]
MLSHFVHSPFFYAVSDFFGYDFGADDFGADHEIFSFVTP